MKVNLRSSSSPRYLDCQTNFGDSYEMCYSDKGLLQSLQTSESYSIISPRVDIQKTQDRLENA